MRILPRFVNLGHVSKLGNTSFTAFSPGVPSLFNIPNIRCRVNVLTKNIAKRRKTRKNSCMTLMWKKTSKWFFTSLEKMW